MIAKNIQTILNITLGDGYLTPDTKNRNKNSRYECRHSIKQKEYVLHKKQLLEIHGYYVRYYEMQYKEGQKGQYKFYCGLTSQTHHDFTIARKWLYNKQRKCIDNTLLKCFTPELIAYWFMDDGSYHATNKIQRKKGTYVYSEKVNRVYEIYMCGFTFEDAHKVQSFIAQSYNITFTVRNHDGPVLRISNLEERKKFKNLIQPYIGYGMEYKIMHPLTFDGIEYNFISAEETERIESESIGISDSPDLSI